MATLHSVAKRNDTGKERVGGRKEGGRGDGRGACDAASRTLLIFYRIVFQVNWP